VFFFPFFPTSYALFASKFGFNLYPRQSFAADNDGRPALNTDEFK